MPRSRIKHYFRHGTLPQLAVFESIARLRSFTRAAEELHLAQPTVSVQIRKLTETVGTALFDQVGKQIFLTEAGRELQKYCDGMFQGLETLEDALADLREVRSGCLRLGVGTVGESFAPRMLAGFLQRHPGVNATLAIHNRQVLIGRMARGEDDLYLFANPPEDRDIVRQAILPNQMVVLARKDHPLAGSRGISPQRLAQENFLMREPGSGTRAIAEAVFAQHGLTPHVRMELSANHAVIDAIVGGIGVSILSRHAVGLGDAQCPLVELDVQGFPLQRPWYFAYPAGHRLSRVAADFMAFVRTSAASSCPGSDAVGRGMRRSPRPALAPVPVGGD